HAQSPVLVMLAKPDYVLPGDVAGLFSAHGGIRTALAGALVCPPAPTARRPHLLEMSACRKNASGYGSSGITPPCRRAAYASFEPGWRGRAPAAVHLVDVLHGQVLVGIGRAVVPDQMRVPCPGLSPPGWRRPGWW